MKTQQQFALKMYTKLRAEIQMMRIVIDDRLGLKADGTDMNVPQRTFLKQDFENFHMIARAMDAHEAEIEKMLMKALQGMPIYNEWLKTVKGVGAVVAGWMLGCFDIEEATTVSKMWQYAGLNPGMVRGMKRIKVKDYKETDGEVIQKAKDKEGHSYIVRTYEMIRGDRAMKDFILPYNKQLRIALCGLMADSFIKSQNMYAIEFYYPYKQRLEQEENVIVGGTKKWKDVSKGHRDRAAKRYMVKMFLKDLYVAWRTMEGLPVRKPYDEEYLGHVHEDKVSRMEQVNQRVQANKQPEQPMIIG